MTWDEFREKVRTLADGKMQTGVTLKFACNVDDFVDAGCRGKAVKMRGEWGGSVLVEPDCYLPRGSMVDVTSQRAGMTPEEMKRQIAKIEAESLFFKEAAKKIFEGGGWSTIVPAPTLISAAPNPKSAEPAGLSAWLKPWQNCPCGSEEHQAGGHPKPEWRIIRYGATNGDTLWREAREATSDAIAGCRLGCACSIHKPTKPATWVPSVTDWDLLPDA